ncbi:copper chaperone PCu(A)C [Paracoccus aestuariivivens]|nr:copper chaperone PCu(A)C [Paracoccus aestuariivivens]
MKMTISIAALGASLLLAAGPAFAHATLEQTEAPAGATYKAVVRIGHGCGSKPTKTLRVQIPDGFYNAKPMPKAGWTLKTVTGDYARPFDNHGTQMTKGVREIIWTGGELPDEWYDEFVFRGTVGPDVVAGSTIYFPTIQECGTAKEAWIDVTGAEGVANPAPALNVTEAKGNGHAHHGAAAPSHGDHAAAEITVGDLKISSPFSRATPPGAPVGGGFLTVANGGSADDRLVSASSPAAEKVEIHEMAMEGDVMKMRQLPDGLPIPAGTSVDLKPGGFHLMLMGLKQPLIEGESVPLTLEFEKAGKVDLSLQVGPMNAKGNEHAHH